jgi:hypothetical protein
MIEQYYFSNFVEVGYYVGVVFATILSITIYYILVRWTFNRSFLIWNIPMPIEVYAFLSIAWNKPEYSSLKHSTSRFANQITFVDWYCDAHRLCSRVTFPLVAFYIYSHQFYTPVYGLPWLKRINSHMKLTVCVARTTFSLLVYRTVKK